MACRGAICICEERAPTPGCYFIDGGRDGGRDGGYGDEDDDDDGSVNVTATGASHDCHLSTWPVVA